MRAAKNSRVISFPISVKAAMNWRRCIRCKSANAMRQNVNI